MGRVLKVVLYAVIILIIYLWISAIMNSGKKIKSGTAIQSEQQDSISSLKDSHQGQSDENTIDEEDDSYISNEDIVSGKIPYKDVDKIIEELNKNKTINQKENNTTVSSSNQTSELKKLTESTTQTSPPEPRQETKKPAIKPEPVQSKTVQLNESGDYMVVAGSYILEENANKMVKKLRGMGYENAGVFVFTASEYYSVVASRHPTYEKAQIAVDALKRKGVDCFVKIKN